MQIEELIDEKFLGEWKRLRRNVLDRSEERAIKACIELAIFLRFLDDQEKISEYLREDSGRTFGKLVMGNSEEKPLWLRDVMNKIIHASDFSWDFSDKDNPILICNSIEKEKWRHAEVHIVRLAAFVGEQLV